MCKDSNDSVARVSNLSTLGGTVFFLEVVPFDLEEFHQGWRVLSDPTDDDRERCVRGVSVEADGSDFDGVRDVGVVAVLGQIDTVLVKVVPACGRSDLS